MIISNCFRLSVRKLSENWVKPCKPTQSNNNNNTRSSLMTLSSVDKFFQHKLDLINTLFVFKHGKEPAKIIREALSKTLVLYFPVAGEFLISEQGELEVACTDRGVWFVEASANCTLEDAGYNCLDNPDNGTNILEQHLFPQPPPQVLNPTDLFLLIQVTQFKCGGFIVGFRFNHVVFDGSGIAQLMKAIGESARGFDQPTVHPIWCRDDMPMKPRLKLNFPPPATLENKTLDVSLQHINQMKNSFIKLQTSTGKKTCTTFEVLAAKLWRSRLRAMKTNRDVLVRLAFLVNLRGKHFMRGLLPQEGEGYYGNCVYIKEVEAPCGKIVGGSFSEVVELIQDAKRVLPSEVHAWMGGGCRPNKDSLFGPADHNLLVTDWTSIGLNDVDYGWGVPQSIIPVQLGDGPVPPVCVVISSAPKFEHGVRLFTCCVEEEHLEEFLSQMSKFD